MAAARILVTARIVTVVKSLVVARKVVARVRYANVGLEGVNVAKTENVPVLKVVLLIAARALGTAKNVSVARIANVANSNNTRED